MLKPTEQQKEIVESLGERAEVVRNGGVDASVDNMLKITNDGRKLALDQRLVNELLPDNPESKISVCAEKSYEIWKDTAAQKSAQLIFCDLSTPKGDGSFNVYDDLKRKLMEKGVPEKEIAFIHDANTEAKKTELFGKVKSGQVRFLIGSTAKMGAGTNVQDRLIALHHLDIGWKPYFYGNSYFSHGATQDVISSMINNKSKSMSFFYKDEIIPCKMRIGESICIDEKVGTMYLYPIISKDFRRVCKETGVKEGCFFNTFSDLSSMASFFEIGSKIYHSNSMDTFGYTEQLEKMYRNKSTENEKTIFWFGIELVNGNDVEKKLMSFEYACNWNSLSGYVCALVAEWCLNDEISKGKAYNLDEIEGIQKFIESLPGEIKQNIVKL